MESRRGVFGHTLDRGRRSALKATISLLGAVIVLAGCASEDTMSTSGVAPSVPTSISAASTSSPNEPELVPGTSVESTVPPAPSTTVPTAESDPGTPGSTPSTELPPLATYTTPDDGAYPAALLLGSLSIDGDCWMFDSADGSYPVLMPPTASVTIDGATPAVIGIAKTPVLIGHEVVLGGGETSRHARIASVGVSDPFGCLDVDGTLVMVNPSS